MWDPFGSKLLNAFPQSNLPGNFNNYARTGSVVDDTDSYDGRIDWNASDKDSVFARYAYWDEGKA
jgi:hypothetical protein